MHLETQSFAYKWWSDLSSYQSVNATACGCWMLTARRTSPAPSAQDLSRNRLEHVIGKFICIIFLCTSVLWCKRWMWRWGACQFGVAKLVIINTGRFWSRWNFIRYANAWPILNTWLCIEENRWRIYATPLRNDATVPPTDAEMQVLQSVDGQRTQQWILGLRSVSFSLLDAITSWPFLK